jgi:hypothetical protein
MKTILIYTIAGIIFISCKTMEIIVPVDFTNYEVQPLEQGIKGTVLLKVFSYEYTVTDAIERAKFDAIHAILFKGIQGSNSAKPLDKNGYEAHKEYYDDFFGLYKIKTTESKFKNGEVEPLKIAYTFNAPYRLYVQISSDGSIDPADRYKVGNKYKVGVVVSVNKDLLRNKLEQDGIITKMTDGF